MAVHEDIRLLLAKKETNNYLMNAYLSVDLVIISPFVKM